MNIFFIHFKNSFIRIFLTTHNTLLTIIAVFQYMYVLLFHHVLVQL